VKTPCGDCYGNGVIVDDRGFDTRVQECSTCRGTGEIEDEDRDSG